MFKKTPPDVFKDRLVKLPCGIDAVFCRGNFSNAHVYDLMGDKHCNDLHYPFLLMDSNVYDDYYTRLDNCPMFRLETNVTVNYQLVYRCSLSIFARPKPTDFGIYVTSLSVEGSSGVMIYDMSFREAEAFSNWIDDFIAPAFEDYILKFYYGR